MLLVKPKAGKRVLVPGSYKPLPAEGMEIECVDTYWFRRERDGDVSISSVVSQPVSKPQHSKKLKSENENKEI